MKKALIILVAALSLFAMVSCKEEVEPTRPVKVSYDGCEYEFNYVATQFYEGDGLIVYLLKDMGDICGLPYNTTNYICFQIPLAMLNKTSVVGTDTVELYGTFKIDKTAFNFETTELSNGTRFSITYSEKDGKITDIEMSFDGQVYGTALSFSCSGTPEESVFIPADI